MNLLPFAFSSRNVIDIAMRIQPQEVLYTYMVYIPTYERVERIVGDNIFAMIWQELAK